MPTRAEYTHDFDSSRTCNYCGVAAEMVAGIAERVLCPTRMATAMGIKGVKSTGISMANPHHPILERDAEWTPAEYECAHTICQAIEARLQPISAATIANYEAGIPLMVAAIDDAGIPMIVAALHEAEERGRRQGALAMRQKAVTALYEAGKHRAADIVREVEP